MTTLKAPLALSHFQTKRPQIMIRTVIIDSDIDAHPLLFEVIKEHVSAADLVGLARNTSQGIHCIESHKPDLVIINLETYGDSIFEMLDYFKNPTFKIVFISEDDKSALKAFKYDAVDYIVKPYTTQDILTSLDRVKRTQFNEAIYNRLDYLIRQNHFGQNHKITIPTSDGINVVSVSDILRVEADRSYCLIYLTDGDRILVSKPLKEIESLLPENIFFRVHSAYLINLDYVKRYIKEDGGNVILNDGSHIPIARRRKKEFFERLGQ